MKNGLMLILLFMLVSCDQDGEKLTEDQLRAIMQTTSESIESLVSLSCDNTDQCKAAPIGAKACGGATHYIIYSVNTDEEKLFQLISEYTQANEKLNDLTGAISDCALVNPPNLDCVSGNCVVVEVK